ncbi:MAG: hypothetical protein R3E32_25175 [Chitinophagales bacterium]
MKKIQISLFLIIAFLLTSCQKEHVSSSPQNPMSFLELSKTAEDMDGNINLLAYGHKSINAAPASISIDGHFFKDNGDLALINTFKVNGVNIPQVDVNNYQYDESIGRGNGDIAKYNLLTPSFGNTATINVSSNEFPNFTENVNLPTIIEFTNTIDEVNTNSNLTIQWNGINTGSKIGILILYNAAESHKENPTLPEDLISVVKYIDDHIGQATFTTQELSDFPVGGIASIYIGRTIQTVINADSKEVLVNGISINRLNWLPIL